MPGPDTHPELPLADYDSLAAAQIESGVEALYRYHGRMRRLPYEALLAYEKANLNRSAVIEWLETFDEQNGVAPAAPTPALITELQTLEAAYILAPLSYTDLANKGSSPEAVQATLVGGATMGDGLIPDFRSAYLNGSSGYVNSGWETLTNLQTNPSFETNTDTVHSLKGAANRILSGEATSGSYLLELTKTTAPNEQYGVYFNSITVKPNTQYTVSIDYIKEKTGREAHLGAETSEGTHWSSYFKPASAGGPGRISVRFTTGPNVTSITPVFYTGTKGGLEGDYMWVDSLLIVQGPRTAYFPTEEQLENGEAGWAGTADGSQSDLGPFARGTARTLIGAGLRDTLGTNGYYGDGYNGLWGGSTGAFTVRVGGSDVYTSPHLARVYKAQLPAVVFDLPNNKVRFYLEGDQINEISTEKDFANGGIMTAGYAFGALFDGALLPYALFTKALTAEEIADLHEVALMSGAAF